MMIVVNKAKEREGERFKGKERDERGEVEWREERGEGGGRGRSDFVTN